MTTFQYEKLNISLPTIRLLSVITIDGSSVPHISLEAHSLADIVGDYEAISYTWGPETPTHILHIKNNNDHGYATLQMRTNIALFLSHCAKSGLAARKKLWIDAICINQADDSEKSTQVRMMDKIFASAERVIVWLDVVSEQSRLTEKGLNEVWNALETQNHRAAGMLDWALGLSGTVTAELGSFSDSQVCVLTEIQSLLKHQYWTRLWIVQELALARHAVFVTATGVLDITSLRLDERSFGAWHAFQNFHIDEFDLVSLEETLEFCGQIKRIGSSHKRNGRFTGLRNISPLFHGRQCFDPRDRVFGLIGMTGLADTYPVDYSACAEQVFAHALFTMSKEADREKFIVYLIANELLTLIEARALYEALKLTVSSCMSFLNKQELSTRHSWLDPMFNVGLEWNGIFQDFCEACNTHADANKIIPHSREQCPKLGPGPTVLSRKTSASHVGTDCELYRCNLSVGLALLLTRDEFEFPQIKFIGTSLRDFALDPYGGIWYKNTDGFGISMSVIKALETSIRTRRIDWEYLNLANERFLTDSPERQGRGYVMGLPCSVMTIISLIELEIKLQKEMGVLRLAIEQEDIIQDDDLEDLDVDDEILSIP